MLVATNREGQLCNQLIYESHVLASALEHGHDVIFARITNEQQMFFELKLLDEIIHIRCVDSIFLNVISKVRRKIIKRDDNVEKNSSRITNAKNKLDSSKVIFVNWWLYRDYPAFWRHQREIKNFFRIKSHIFDNTKREFDKLKGESICTIAIHLRRGDYREWQGGKYYYGDEVVKNWMMDLSEQCQCCFFLFSNEKIDEDSFLDVPNNYYCIKMSTIEELAMMSMCDYIIGPPSTFSYWAAFIGDRKYYRVYEKNEKIELQNFQQVGLNE